jgi:hypothetical protein
MARIFNKGEEDNMSTNSQQQPVVGTCSNCGASTPEERQDCVDCQNLSAASSDASQHPNDEVVQRRLAWQEKLLRRRRDANNWQGNSLSHGTGGT